MNDVSIAKSYIEMDKDTAEMIKLANMNVENSAKITEHHKTVSNLDTPKYFIKSKGGVDYVEYSYMRDVADEYFPGWSWNIIYRELGSEAYEVHGRLKWFDNGLWREGDTVAAHRVQKKRDGSGFVDIGNDIKAANTDAIKKAFNMYLNIADDVYRNRVEDLSLNDGDIAMIIDEIKDLDSEWKSKIEGSLERGEILKPDLNRVIDKIQTIKGEANE